MKKTVAILLALIMVMSLAACGSSGSTPSPAPDSPSTQAPADSNPSAPSENVAAPEKGDGVYTPSDETLVVAHKGNPTGLCFLTVSAVSVNNPTLCTLYDRLLAYNDETNSVDPMLATEWEYIDDTHVRFKLRDDVYSHSGHQFTAEDVIYTVTTGQESGLLGNYYSMFNLAECKAEDDFTVVLATNDVDPYFLYTLSNVPLAMLVKETVDADGGLEAQGLHPTAGTGPYKFVEWSDGSYIKLERNEDYWGGTPYYKNVEIRIITDASARVMNLESGDVDIALDPDATSVSILEGNDAYSIINLPTSNISGIYFNCTKEPFNDVNARRAVCLALNYEANLAIATGSFGELSDSFLPKASSAYVSPEEGGYESYFHFDLEAAKAALAESAYPDGFSFELIYAENPTWNAFAEMIQNQLSELGITVKLVPLASTVFYDYTSSGNFDAHMVNSANPDPAVQLRYFDKRIDFTTMRGGSGFVDAPDELLELMDNAKVALDDGESRELYTQIQAIINEYCPVAPLYSPNKVCVSDSDILGLKLTEFGDIDIAGAYKAG